MDRQAALNKVYDHFITKENPPSYSGEDGGCRYRGSNGEKCAIGVLIPDEIYREEMDSNLNDNDVAGVLKLYPEVRSLLEVEGEVTENSYDFPDSDVCFLDQLQSAHDMAAQGSWWQGSFKNLFLNKLNSLALNWGLTLPNS